MEETLGALENLWNVVSIFLQYTCSFILMYIHYVHKLPFSSKNLGSITFETKMSHY